MEQPRFIDRSFGDFPRAYRLALEAYVGDPTDEAREHAAGLGELAAQSGVSVTRVIRAHREALSAVVPLTPDVESVLRRARLAESFLEQCLCPYDSAMFDARVTREGLRRSEATLAACRTQKATLDEALASMSFTMSHDIREPVNAIDEITRDLLEDGKHVLDTETRESLKRVRSRAAYYHSLADGALELARLAQADLKLEEVDLSGIVDSVADELLRSDPTREVTFVVTPGAHETADAGLIEIALRHLLGNAWKFTSTRGEARIEFGMAHRAGRLTYFVADDGVGFDMSDADRLGIAFQRLHPAGEFGGIGLGLAGAERIVHRHGGDFWAEAEAGQGATFFFTLDATRPDVIEPHPRRRRPRAEEKRAA